MYTLIAIYNDNLKIATCGIACYNARDTYN